MKEHPVNQLDNFILGFYGEDTTICDELIEYHKNSSEKAPGTISGGKILPEIKESTDVTLLEPNLYHRYINVWLQEKLEKYVQKYSHINEYSAWKVYENVNIQHYAPTQGFHGWHTERCHSGRPEVARLLVFMTYLNDVDKGGGTEFYYQKLGVRPEKGLTLFWPAEWTHTHRGITSLTCDKYIATGWYSFVNENGEPE